MLRTSLRPYLVMGSLIALLLAATAAAGLMVNQFYAPFLSGASMTAALFVQDLISLLAALLLVAAMIGTVRGSRRAFVVWNGVLVYTIYYYSFYIFDNVYNVFYPLYLTLMPLALYSLIGLLSRVDLKAFAAGVDQKMPVRSLAAILGLALLFVPLWGSMIAHDIQAQQPRPTALVFVLDLCFLLPALAVAAVQLWQRQPFGYLLGGILLFKAAISGVLLTLSTLWSLQLGVSPATGELGMYIFLAVAGTGGVIFYMRHLHDSPMFTTATQESKVQQRSYA